MTPEEHIIENVRKLQCEDPARSVLQLIRPVSFEKINCCISNCKVCGNCGKYTLPAGDINSPVLVIGEYPKPSKEPYSDILNEYFISALESVCIDYQKLYYCNCIQCEPENGKLPSKDELNSCYNNHVSKLIFSMQPACILLLGNVASRIYLGSTLQNARGTWNYINGIPTIATYHPEYFVLMQNIKSSEKLKEEYNNFTDDITNAFEYVKLLGYFCK